MDVWLPKDMDRRKALIYILLFSNHEISMTRVSTLLRVNRKTVASDVEFINTRWSDILSLSINKSSVTMQELPNGNVQDIFSNLINESIYMNVLEVIILEKYDTYEELSDSFFLSISTIRRILKQLNTNLAEKKMYINLHTLKLESENQRHLSMFCFYFFIEKNGFLNWPFEHIDQQPLLSVIEKIVEYLDIRVSTRFKFILSYFMGVTIQTDKLEIIPNKKDRCFLVSIEQKVTNYLLDLVTDDSSDELLERLKYMLLSVLTTIYGFINSPYNRRLGHKFIERIEKKLSVSLSDENFEKVMFVFAYIQFTNEVYPYDHFLIYDKDYFDSYSIRNYYPKFSLEIKEGLQFLEKEMKIPWYTRFNNVLLHDLFIVWKDLPKQVTDLRRPVPIAIITPLDIEYLCMIEYFVKEEVGKIIDVLILKENFSVKDYHIYSKELEKIKFIVTNKSMDVYKEKQIIVNDIPERNQLKIIKKLIENEWISQ